MFNPSSRDHTGAGQGTRLNVNRTNSQPANGFDSFGNVQYGGSQGQQYPLQTGGDSYPLGGDSYSSGGGSYPQYNESRGVGTGAADFSQNNQTFGVYKRGEGTKPPSIGVIPNARPGSTSYRMKKPAFHKAAGELGELGEPGWIPKNKPPVHSQSRYQPANMNSPPVNRRQMAQREENTQVNQGAPAWEGTLRPAGGPRGWEENSFDSEYGRGGGGRAQTASPPRESWESHSGRFHQLVNENNDQMEQYMRSPHHSTSYPAGRH